LIHQKRGFVVRGGELQECLLPICHDDSSVPPIEVLGRTPSQPQDAFNPAIERLKDGFEAGSKRRPVELNPVDRLLTTADFQQRLQETLEGTSPRAQQVKQVESTYQSFWKDSQDFAVRKGPSLTVPEPPRYVSPAETAWKGRALTQPDFQASPAQASANRLHAEARRADAVTPPAFSLLGYAALRG